MCTTRERNVEGVGGRGRETISSGGWVDPVPGDKFFLVPRGGTHLTYLQYEKLHAEEVIR